MARKYTVRQLATLKRLFLSDPVTYKASSVTRPEWTLFSILWSCYITVNRPSPSVYLAEVRRRDWKGYFPSFVQVVDKVKS